MVILATHPKICLIIYLEFGDEFNDNAYTDNLTHFRGRGHNNVYDDIN